jgi:hypothetical protein
MQLLASREYPVIDYPTMAEFIGHERLFRMPNGQFFEARQCRKKHF